MMDHRIGHKRVSIAGFVGVIFLTMILFASPVIWYGHKMVLDPFKGVVLMCLLMTLMKRGKLLRHIQPGISLLPTILFFFVVTLYLLNEKYVGINIFSAMLFIIALYALMGLILPRSKWLGLIVPCGLFILLLPFEGYLDVYLGFPLRLFCVERVRELLQIFGFYSFTQESIILIEGKAANVDLACSGIKGLWAGGLFFLLLTIIENYRITWHWFLIGITMGCLLLFANIVRIVTLVFLSLIKDQVGIADHIHIALGLLGFVLSCIATWAIALVACKKGTTAVAEQEQQRTQHQYCYASLFIGGIVSAILLYQPYMPSELPPSSVLQIPMELKPQNVELTPVESRFFQNNNTKTRKFTFTYNGTRGSAIVVSSSYWKGQHEPRNCYKGQGHSINREGTWLIENHKTIRYLDIEGGKTATYWFQSKRGITSEYSSRVFNGIIHPNETWLLVSILWERGVDKDEIEDFVLLVQSSLDKQV